MMTLLTVKSWFFCFCMQAYHFSSPRLKHIRIPAKPHFCKTNAIRIRPHVTFGQVARYHQPSLHCEAPWLENEGSNGFLKHSVASMEKNYSWQIEIQISDESGFGQYPQYGHHHPRAHMAKMMEFCAGGMLEKVRWIKLQGRWGCFFLLLDSNRWFEQYFTGFVGLERLDIQRNMAEVEIQIITLTFQ